MSGKTSHQSAQWSDPGLPPNGLLYAEEWAIDALDRLNHGDLKGAKTSLSYADINVINLPPGSSYGDLEDFLQALRVKLYHKQSSNKQ